MEFIDDKGREGGVGWGMRIENESHYHLTPKPMVFRCIFFNTMGSCLRTEYRS